MKIAIDKELLSIIKEILEASLNDVQWAERESSDYFQTKHYQGGYDADEHAFCFSYYDSQEEEYWFQITLEDTKKISEGSAHFIELRKAE